MRHLSKWLMTLAGAFVCSLSWGAPADPVALWKDFTGLTSEQALLPDRSSTQGGLPGQEWLFNLGAGSVTDGVLQTGTGISPSISFGETLSFGYNDGEKHATVIIAVQAPVALVQNKPFIHLTNDTTGVGVAMYNATTLRGSWGTNYWGNPTNNKTAVTIDDLTTATDVVYIALATNTGNSGDNITRVAIVEPETSTVTWTSISGLYGSGINVKDIRFGNYTSTATSGLDYKLLSAAVYEGRATDETLLSFVMARTANDMAFTTSGACTRVASGAILTLSDGVTLDLGGATFGTEKATIALAEGATSATVKIYTADKVNLNDLPEGVTLIESRPDDTLVWDNMQTTWSADTEWTIEGTENKTVFQEGDTVVFDLDTDTEVTFGGSYKPEAIVVKGAKLTIKASGQTTTVHASTTLSDGASLDVSDTGGAPYLAAVDVGEGCTLFANLDQMPGGISGSGKWCYTSDSVTYASGMANLTIWVKEGKTFQAQQNAGASLPASLSLELEGGARFYFPAGGTIASPIKVLSSATPENPAQLDGSYFGGTTPLTGAITLEGTLKLITGTTNCGNAYNLSGAITGPGGLIVDDSQSQLVALTGANTFTGGLTVNRNVTIDHDAVGYGDITVTAETLTVTNGGTLTILSGKTLAGAGTIYGNVEFADGAILDASQVLSVTGVSSLGTATIKLAAAPAENATALKVLTADSVVLPFEATIVYPGEGEVETALTGWVATFEADDESTEDVNEAGLYIIKADTIKNVELTPPGEGEEGLTWTSVWGDNLPGDTEVATLVLTDNITLDIGETAVQVGAITVKKADGLETTPTLTLLNAPNFAPASILLEGANLAFAGTTVEDATTEIDYIISGSGALTVTGGSVTLANGENTFDGGVTIAKGATVTTTTNEKCVFGSGAITVEGTLNLNAYGCLIGAGQVTIKSGGILNGINNCTWSGKIHLEEGANANFAEQYGLATASGRTAGVFTGSGTVNVTYTNSDIGLPDAATFDSTTDAHPEGWTGTVRLVGLTKDNFDLARFTSASSKLVLAGMTGYTQNGTDYSGYMGEVIVEKDTSWLINNGNSNNKTIFPKISGEGDLKLIHANAAGNPTFTLVAKDFASFAGNVTVDDNYSFVVGASNANRASGKIVVDSNYTVTIAPSKTWSMITTLSGATKEMVLNGTLDLTTGAGTSTIDGALAGTGTIKLGAGRSLKVTGTVADTVTITAGAELLETYKIASTTDAEGATTYALYEKGCAEVNGVPYATIAEAITALGETAATIDIVADSAETLTLTEGQAITLQGKGGSLTGEIVIPEGASLTLIADAMTYTETAWMIGAKVTNNGALYTQGLMTLSNGGNTTKNLTVTSGTLSMAATSEGFSGAVTIAAGAKLNPTSEYSLSVSTTTTIDVYGELAFGNKWPLSENAATFNFYPGATASGSSLNYNSGSVNICADEEGNTGTVIWSATITNTQTPIFYIEPGMTMLLDGFNFADGTVVTVNTDTASETPGVLELKNGTGFFTIQGTALTKVTGSYTLGRNNRSYENYALTTLTTNLEVIEGATLTIRHFRSGTNDDDFVYELKNVKVDGTIATDADHGDVDSVIQIGAGYTLSGKGALVNGSKKLNLAFADGAIYDTSAGIPTIEGAITFGNALTVKVAEVTEAAILSTTGTDATMGEAPATATIIVGGVESTEHELKVEGKALYIVAKAAPAPTFPETVEGDTVPVNDASKEKITEKLPNDATGISKISGVTAPDATGSTALTAEEIDTALQLFTGDSLITTTEPDSEGDVEVTIGYYFGITNVKVKPNTTDTVIVTVKAFATDKTSPLSMVVAPKLIDENNGDAEVTGATVTDVENNGTVYTFELGIDDLQGKKLKAKLSK